MIPTAIVGLAGKTEQKELPIMTMRLFGVEEYTRLRTYLQFNSVKLGRVFIGSKWWAYRKRNSEWIFVGNESGEEIGDFAKNVLEMALGETDEPYCEYCGGPIPLQQIQIPFEEI